VILFLAVQLFQLVGFEQDDLLSKAACNRYRLSSKQFAFPLNPLAHSTQLNWIRINRIQLVSLGWFSLWTPPSVLFGALYSVFQSQSGFQSAWNVPRIL